MKYCAVIGPRSLEVENSEGAFLIDGKKHDVDVAVLPSGVYSLIVDGCSYEVLVRDERLASFTSGSERRAAGSGLASFTSGSERRAAGSDKGFTVEIGAHLIPVRLVDPSRRGDSRIAIAHEGAAVIESPMPGRVIAIKVQVGQVVQQGEGIAVVEAMKMENELQAPKSGKVSKISVKVGDAVEAGQELVVVE